jgi:acetate kinase
LAELEALNPLAPLHQPHNVAVIRAVAQVAPNPPQAACFDTVFHRTQPAVAQAFALPRRYAEEGVRRYGFHGLSDEYIASVVPTSDRRAAEALDLFVYRITRELGSLAAALGGLDALVFTEGIAEKAASIRARVCRGASWLGFGPRRGCEHKWWSAHQPRRKPRLGMGDTYE